MGEAVSTELTIQLGQVDILVFVAYIVVVLLVGSEDVAASLIEALGWPAARSSVSPAISSACTLLKASRLKVRVRMPNVCMFMAVPPSIVSVGCTKFLHKTCHY